MHNALNTLCCSSAYNSSRRLEELPCGSALTVTFTASSLLGLADIGLSALLGSYPVASVALAVAYGCTLGACFSIGLLALLITRFAAHASNGYSMVCMQRVFMLMALPLTLLAVAGAAASIVPEGPFARGTIGLVFALALVPALGQVGRISHHFAHRCRAPIIIAAQGPVLAVLVHAPGSLLAAALACISLATLFVTVFHSRIRGATAARRRILEASLVFGAIAALTLFPAVKPKPRNARAESVPLSEAGCPFVVLVTADTLRWDAVGFNTLADNPARSVAPRMVRADSLTPHLDALAARGVVFSQARAVAPWTLPSCASIHSGLAPDVHGATRADSRVDLSLTTLAERLREAGYATAAFGDNPFLCSWSNLSQGYDVYEFFPRPHASLLGGFLAGSWFSSDVSECTSRQLTDRAMDWVARQAGSPFLLWVHYFDAHAPYCPPPAYAPDPTRAGRIDPQSEYAQDTRSGRFVASMEERRYLRKLYDGDVRSLDEQIGRLIDGLDSAGILPDCLFVFASDHGEEFWEHGGFEHGHSLFDELLRVPLFIKPPRQKRVDELRSMREASVSLQSIFPTILDYCGVRYDVNMPLGPSLLLGGSENGSGSSAPIFCTGLLYYEDASAVLFDGFKLIRRGIGGETQLYDLLNDPHERMDLSGWRQVELARGLAYLQDHMHGVEAARKQLGLVRAPTATLSAETRKRLRSLGYID